MPFLHRLLSPLTRKGTSSPPPSPPRISTYPSILSSDLDRPLKDWSIARHDREALIEDVMPMMAASLQRRHLLSTFLSKHTWANDLLKSELDLAQPEYSTHADHHDPLPSLLSAFWLNPAEVTEHVLTLVRLWFYALLRYTYRRRLFVEESSDSVRRHDLDLSDLEDRNFYSALSEHNVRRLIRHGSALYRVCCKRVKQRPAWTTFCRRIQLFCHEVGLPLSSSSSSSFDPEKDIRHLQRNLTSIVLHRDVSGQVVSNAALVREIARHVKKVDERAVSSAAHHDEMRRNMEEMTRRMEESSVSASTPGSAVPSVQRSNELDAEIQELRALHQERLDEMAREIEQNRAVSNELLNATMDKLRSEFNEQRLRDQAHISADLHNQVRWLLEHLPGKSTYGEGAHRWKLFWDKEWKKTKWEGHPLWQLNDDEQYNRVGKKLYDTLSKRLHNYGVQRGQTLTVDVQRVVNAIKPLINNYDSDGNIDLVAERKRWGV
ncbi:hypothetical protein B0J11DRAFT_529030 [Dendryphion nanum]|uniref:Uncharacterized protein n=1 Tax=Dendryphion nanum TaxID=256645 RepID=A0A9P9DV96_9PLEO|nr:hypothetical protein B0J11DRAFT_529030 [Dendryphion nanum]